MTTPTTFVNHNCPTCGRLNDAITAASPDSHADPTPTVGAVTLCWGCRTWAVVDQALPGRLYLRKPTPAEAAEIAADPDCTRTAFAAATHTTPLEAAHSRRR